MKRFYRTVATAAEDGGHLVLLDGRAVRTPAKAVLCLPTVSLAASVAGEWQAQDAEIKPHSMPMTQLSFTALDLTAAKRHEIVEATATYASNDLLCYRAERPEALRQRQQALWQPLLDWAQRRYDAPLAVTSSILSVEQPEQSVEAFFNLVEGLEEFALTGLSHAVSVTGSLILGLALMEGFLDAAGIFEASELDESFQLEQWGEDAEATRLRAARLADLESAERFLKALSLTQQA
ncbi:MAG: ATPase [Rhodospirillales bacterium]|nr:ATPase [Rhodospirillales bacterium]